MRRRHHSGSGPYPTTTTKTARPLTAMPLPATPPAACEQRRAVDPGGVRDAAMATRCPRPWACSARRLGRLGRRLSRAPHDEPDRAQLRDRQGSPGLHSLQGRRHRGRRRKMMHDPMHHPTPEPGRLRQAPRCGARTRSGKPCQSPAVNGRRRCRMHGGAPGSGGPKGARDGNYKRGFYTVEAIAYRRWLRQQVRQVKALTKALP
jgi:hypothetical protein